MIHPDVKLVLLPPNPCYEGGELSSGAEIGVLSGGCSVRKSKLVYFIIVDHMQDIILVSSTCISKPTMN